MQTSLIAGTLFQSTHLALTIWFLAIYLVSQAKTGLSALDLKRQLGVSYPTAWLIQQKLMQAMVERDTQYTLCGDIPADDAYLGGELAGGKAVVGNLEGEVLTSQDWKLELGNEPTQETLFHGSHLNRYDPRVSQPNLQLLAGFVVALRRFEFLDVLRRQLWWIHSGRQLVELGGHRERRLVVR